MDELDKPGAVLEIQYNITRILDSIFKLLACLCAGLALVFGIMSIMIPTEAELQKVISALMSHLSIVVLLASLYLALFIGWPIYRLRRESIARKWLYKNAKVERYDIMMTVPSCDGKTSRIKVIRVFDSQGRLIARIYRPLDDDADVAAAKNSEKTTPVD